MQILKMGLIGAGHMGQNHARILSEEKSIHFVGIYDVNVDQAHRVADLYDCPVFTDMEELLKSVDAVVVAVPSSLHKEIGLQVAAHQVHALIEKPLGMNVEEARELTDAFAQNGLKLQVGHVERFNPVIVELEKILKNDQIFFLEAHRYSAYSDGGRITDTSVVEDLLIHDADIVCRLMEPHHVTKISGMGERVLSNNIDFATGILEFDSNAHAIINVSRVSQDKERTLDILTQDSFIQADLLNKTLTIAQKTNLTVEGNLPGVYKQDSMVQKIFIPNVEPLKMEHRAFCEAIVNDTPTVVDGEAGIRAIDICDKVIADCK